MTERTIDRIESKLDNIVGDITKIKISVAKTEEHLKTLNGSVDSQKSFCSTTTGSIITRIRTVEQKMWLAYGGIIVIGLLGSLKAMGLW